MRLRLLLALIGLTLNVHSQDFSRRIECWLMLDQFERAWEDVTLWVDKEPESAAAKSYRVIIAAKRADYAHLSNFWREFEQLQPEPSEWEHTLEEMAWAVLYTASRSDSVQQRVMSLIGQAMTHDVRALPTLRKALYDPAPFVRSLAAKALPFCCDLEASKELEQVAEREPLPDIKAELLQALGRCGAPSSHSLLLRYIHGKEAQLQVAALSGLANQRGSIDSSLVMLCLKHPRVAMRSLGCQIASYLPLGVAWQQLCSMTSDPHLKARRMAWMSMQSLRLPPASFKLLRPCWDSAVKSLDASTLIQACVVGMRAWPDESLQILRDYCSSGDQWIRLQAITALSRSGPIALSALKEIARSHSDRYMRINALLALLAFRCDIAQVGTQLQQELDSLDQRVMSIDGGCLLAIAPSEVRHHPGISNYPEAVDLMTRLRMMHVLRCAGIDPDYHTLIRWLGDARWGLSAAAAQFMLSEGNSDAVAVVQGLLSHPDEHIRLEAALVVASVGRDEAALPVLKQMLSTADPQQKERIIEAAASLGAQELLPDLMAFLVDQSPMMRVSAASAILQILYH